VRDAGADGHDPGTGRRTAALNRKAGTCRDGSNDYRGCDECERSGQSPWPHATA